jgi:hypothetical protein
MAGTAYVHEGRGIEDEFHHVVAELHEVRLPEVRKRGRWFAKTVNDRILTDLDMCMLMFERGGYTGDINEMMRFLRYYFHEVGYQICDGNAVRMGNLCALYPRIRGQFNIAKTGIYEIDNPLTVHFRLLRGFYDILSHIKVTIRGIAGSGAMLYEFIDTESGLTNKKATPGGQFTLLARKSKVAGEGSGIFFVSADTPPFEAPVTKPLAINNPSRIVGTIPDLPPGKLWAIEVRTRYTRGVKPLNELRIIRSNFMVST